MSNLKILLLVGTIMCSHFLNAQNSACQVPEGITKGKLAIEFPNNTIKSGTFSTIEAYFKMAAKSNEVNKADWVSCDGFMPNGAKIIFIEITSITGLPEGLQWSCDRENCLYEGATTGCVTYQGTTTQKGTHQIVIHLKGVGSIWGIKKEYDCVIKTYKIVVE